MARIGIFDSGVGGLSVLREIRKILPGEDCIYYADTANCPYGEKTREFIISRSEAITQLLLDRGADIIVVACNTATAAAIATLRARFPVRFVGIEPAVKPAALSSRTGAIGVLATASTLSSAKYLKMKEIYGDKVKIAEGVGQGFVELVETGELTGPRAEAVVRASLEPLLAAGADRIALGCTHYPFLKPTLEKVAAELAAQASAPLSFRASAKESPAPDIRVIDPAVAVARRLAFVLAEEGIPLLDGDAGVTELLASGPDAVLKQLYKTL